MLLLVSSSVCDSYLNRFISVCFVENKRVLIKTFHFVRLQCISAPKPTSLDVPGGVVHRSGFFFSSPLPQVVPDEEVKEAAASILKKENGRQHDMRGTTWSRKTSALLPTYRQYTTETKVIDPPWILFMLESGKHKRSSLNINPFIS